MNATTCAHPKAFFALDRNGCRTREATPAEVYAWVIGQRHPRFSMASPNFLCFDNNVRTDAGTITRETACTCPTNQPYMD